MEENKNTNNTRSQSSTKSSNGKFAVTDTLKEKASSLLSINEDHQEGDVTKAIEEQTSKIPSVFYLSLAVGSMAVSAVAAMSNRKELANFIGLWAPSILLLGIYNKIVKTQGSDMKHSPAQ